MQQWLTTYTCVLSYSNYRGSSFSEAHAFIGYQKDTPAAVVFQATKVLRRLQHNHQMASKVEHLLVRAKHLLKAGIITHDLADLSEDSRQWNDSVSILILCECFLYTFVCTRSFPIIMLFL